MTKANFEELLKEELGEDITASDRIDDVAVDSLDYLSFIKRLEEEFHVAISEAELSGVSTFAELEEVVEARAHV